MIIQGACNSFREELLQAIHDFETDTIKIALYYESANLSPNTTVYTTTGEVTGTGYSAGGQNLVSTISMIPGVAWVQWDNISWTVDDDFSARGAMIYNHTKGDKAILILDFGVTRYPSDGYFPITFPPDPALSAPLRLT